MILRLASKTVYANRWMTVREDRVRFQNGTEGIYGVVEKPDFALIIPFENDGFHLVRQFRYPIGKESWEFPQGSIESNEIDPLTAAHRELEEETGLIATEMTALGFLYEANGYCTQGFHILLADSLTKGSGKVNLEDSESGMICQWFSLSDFESMLDRAEIRDAPTVAAFSLFLRRQTRDKS